MSTAGSGWVCALLLPSPLLHRASVWGWAVSQPQVSSPWSRLHWCYFVSAPSQRAAGACWAPKKPNPRCLSATAHFAAVSNQRHCVSNSDSSAPFLPNLKEKQIDNEILHLQCFCDV